MYKYKTATGYKHLRYCTYANKPNIRLCRFISKCDTMAPSISNM